MTISLDGFVGGPTLLRPRGAYVMGRNMFGPVRGPWSSMPDWQGWWGDEPPCHAPCLS